MHVIRHTPSGRSTAYLWRMPAGGAPIQIGTLASSPYQAELWSSGGNITVGSLDGFAYIESHGDCLVLASLSNTSALKTVCKQSA